MWTSVPQTPARDTRIKTSSSRIVGTGTSFITNPTAGDSFTSAFTRGSSGNWVTGRRQTAADGRIPALTGVPTGVPTRVPTRCGTLKRRPPEGPMEGRPGALSPNAGGARQRPRYYHGDGAVRAMSDAGRILLLEASSGRAFAQRTCPTVSRNGSVDQHRPARAPLLRGRAPVPVEIG